jgi:Ca2+ transporting ATPase
MLQVFNFLNARRIQDEINIFERIFTNHLFPGIVLFIFCAQIIIVTFGSLAFGLYSNFGLMVKQWLITIGFGSLSLPMSVVIKFIKEEMCFETGSKEVNPFSQDSKVLQMRQSHNALARRMSSIVPYFLFTLIASQQPRLPANRSARMIRIASSYIIQNS